MIAFRAILLVTGKARHLHQSIFLFLLFEVIKSTLNPQEENCVIPENIHTPPMEKGFINFKPHLPSPHPCEIPFSCQTFLQSIGLLKPPYPLEFL